MGVSRTYCVCKTRDTHQKQPEPVSTSREFLIERWARDPDALSAEERARVETWVSSDVESRSAAEFWRAFFEQSDELRSHVAPSQVQSFVSEMFAAPFTLTLTPWAPSQDGHAVGEPPVWKADAPQPSTRSAFTNVATLAHEDEGVLVRIMRDEMRGHYRLYILAEPQETYAHALVELPEANVQMVTDERGRTRFSVSERVEPQDLGARAILRRAVGSVQLPAAGTVAPVELENGLRLVVRRADGSVVVEASSENDQASPTRAALVTEDREKSIFTFSDDLARVKLSEQTSGTLYFYL